MVEPLMKKWDPTVDTHVNLIYMPFIRVYKEGHMKDGLLR